MEKSSAQNELYLNLLVDTTNECFNICYLEDKVTDKTLNDENFCIESCFSKYFIGYNQLNRNLSN